jgi:glycine/D-amino acid oxidase-like deaminating enzyme
MADGKLAVIGLGSIGSMALWQASRLSDSVTGFEAASPAHGRSAVGGDTRRVYCATGFSGAGFKNATGFGEIAPNEALGKQTFNGLDFVRPERFSSRQPVS